MRLQHSSSEPVFAVKVLDAETPEPAKVQRRLLVRRSVKAATDPASSREGRHSAASGRKPTLLAHRVRPGEPVQLKSSPGVATLLSDDQLMEPVPETIGVSSAIGRTRVGQKMPATGSIGGSLGQTSLSHHSLIGPLAEFEEMHALATGNPRPRAGNRHASMGQLDGYQWSAPADSDDLGGTNHPQLRRLQAADAKQRSKSLESLRAVRRAYRSQEAALRNYERYQTSWEQQMLRLSSRLGGAFFMQESQPDGCSAPGHRRRDKRPVRVAFGGSVRQTRADTSSVSGC